MVELETSVAREAIRDAYRGLRQESFPRYSHRNLYDEVLRLHPNGDMKAWKGYTGDNVFSQSAYSNNQVQIRFDFRGRTYTMDESEIRTEKCEHCIAKSYNPGIQKMLCMNPAECPAVNPLVSDHTRLGFKGGERARIYPQLPHNDLA